MNRREFIQYAAAVSVFGTSQGRISGERSPAARLRVGVCDWSIRQRGKIEALDVSAEIGLDGVQISPVIDGGRLSYAEHSIQKAYQEKAKKTGVLVSSLAATFSNKFPLATDPRAVTWLEQSIDAAAVFRVKVILLAFFSKGDLLTKDDERKLKEDEIKRLVKRLKAVSSRAEDEGIVLGLETTLSAKQHLDIIDAVGSPAVQVYYDIANSTRNGYDVPSEIRSLGKGRICEFHFKSNEGRFNSGEPDVDPIIRAVKKIGYQGWLVLERNLEKDNMIGYFRHNASYVRKAFGI